MKIRNGFVSNSSSSSFIIDARKFDEDTIRRFIQAHLDASSIIDEDVSTNMENICEVQTESSVLSFAKKIVSYSFYDLKGEEERLEVEQTFDRLKLQFPGEVIIVDSVDDNSIPWSIQEELENIGKRYHWG